jgi:predicted transport protein
VFKVFDFSIKEIRLELRVAMTVAELETAEGLERDVRCSDVGNPCRACRIAMLDDP